MDFSVSLPVCVSESSDPDLSVLNRLADWTSNGDVTVSLVILNGKFQKSNVLIDDGLFPYAEHPILILTMSTDQD